MSIGITDFFRTFVACSESNKMTAIVGVLNKRAIAIAADSAVTMSSCLCPQSDMDGTFFTQKQIEDITNRISKNVYSKILKQVESAISSDSTTKIHVQNKQRNGNPGKR